MRLKDDYKKFLNQLEEEKDIVYKKSFQLKDEVEKCNNDGELRQYLYQETKLKLKTDEFLFYYTAISNLIDFENEYNPFSYDDICLITGVLVVTRNKILEKLGER